ncbi:cupredoxin domain-containing protein [Rossellomorea arthrocnemi]|uniref:cupredoxin domain-containing protein n=1 Tax=Rossellomorea arthrocnemi TaxID=2769542 RepID=UPI00191B3E5D|nr:cupredoxin domain-containing protein [Rossellomorea arthrocnemi]
MAGLMGGMMGAIFGEMISPNESIVILKILSVLSLSSIFLFFIFLRAKPDQYLITKKWLFKPLIVFVTFLIFLVSGELIFKSATMPYADSPKEQTGHQSQYIHNSSNQHEGIHTINIIASDMRYQPSTLTVAKGTTVRIVLQNDDQVEHDIEIKGITANFTDSPGGGPDHSSQSNKSFHLHAQVNSSNQLEFHSAEKGVYDFSAPSLGIKKKV